MAATNQNGTHGAQSRQGDANRVRSDIGRLALLLERYVRIEATERLTTLTTAVVVGVVAFGVLISAIFFLGTGLVQTLTAWTGSEMLSYYLVGAGFLLLILLVFLFKGPLLERPLLRKFGGQLLEGPLLTEQVLKDKLVSTSELHQLAKSLAEELDLHEGYDDYDEEGGAL